MGFAYECVLQLAKGNIDKNIYVYGFKLHKIYKDVSINHGEYIRTIAQLYF